MNWAPPAPDFREVMLVTNASVRTPVYMARTTQVGLQQASVPIIRCTQVSNTQGCCGRRSGCQGSLGGAE